MSLLSLLLTGGGERRQGKIRTNSKCVGGATETGVEGGEKDIEIKTSKWAT